MRSLIENIIDQHISLLIERRTGPRIVRRRGHTRRSGQMTRKQRREWMYNRAFENTVADENGVKQLLKFVTETVAKQRNKPYSWALTRWTWISKRLLEFAKKFKKPTPSMGALKQPSLHNEYLYLYGDEPNDGKENEYETRRQYIITNLSTAMYYGKKNKNGWNDVVECICGIYGSDIT